MDGIARRTLAAVGLALVATLCIAAPALATDGSVKGTKWHDLDADGAKEAGEPVLKDWWIYLDKDRDGNHDSGEPAVRTDAAGNYSISGIRWWAVNNHAPQTYDVREKPASQQPQPSLDGCSYPSGCKHTLTFSNSSHIYSGKNFGNHKTTGQIKVVKKLLPSNDPGTFDLSVNGAKVASGGDGATATVTVPTGSGHSVAEAGATLSKYDSSLSCTDGTTGTTSATGVKVTAGQTTVCTFTNTRKATVTLTKTEGGRTDLSQVWSFVLRGGLGNVSIARTTAGGNPIDFGPLLPGAYTLCEVGLPAGWISSLGPAIGGEACVAVDLVPGEAETVAVDNTRPAIELLKQVRRSGDQAWAKVAAMQVGQTAEYLLTVTNPGVGPLVDLVVLDDRCDAAPVYVGGDADADRKLDETEAWTYRCDHVVVAADGAQFVNTATADAADERGNPVRDTDSATVTVTVPPPLDPPTDRPPSPPASSQPDAQQILPAEIVSGTARLRGPSGCVVRPFKARVSGRRIARVTFWLDGRQVERIVAKRGQTTFALTVDPRKIGFGVHRVRARVVFASASRTAPRTMRLSFQRCARRAGTPRFTG
jgi:hypothetical protein